MYYANRTKCIKINNNKTKNMAASSPRGLLLLLSPRLDEKDKVNDDKSPDDVGLIETKASSPAVSTRKEARITIIA